MRLEDFYGSCLLNGVFKGSGSRGSYSYMLGQFIPQGEYLMTDKFYLSATLNWGEVVRSNVEKWSYF